jgi:hypothetical protein
MDLVPTSPKKIIKKKVMDALEVDFTVCTNYSLPSHEEMKNSAENICS